MLRYARVARRHVGAFAPTYGLLRKGVKKSNNPYPHATRTVIYTKKMQQQQSSSSSFPLSASVSTSSPVFSTASSSSFACNNQTISDSSKLSSQQPPLSESLGTTRKFADKFTASSTTSAVTMEDAEQNDVLKNFDVLNFPALEEEVMQLWREKDAFRTSLKMSEGKKPYNFYDGPPFATGLPHYGHILAGTIKDMVTRWAHQTGHHVERRFGWDCHGLPIEFEIDKELGIKTSHDVLNYGIGNYNDRCQAIVMRYATEWRRTVERMGRWIDFDNDYKTMNLSYMESVWWVFAQLWEKKLVYRGFKVMPFSTGCTTPLSNFEANSNYKDATDPSVTVALQSADDENTFFLAWTTTPWTLPSNVALCVNKDVDYVQVLDTKTGRHYYLAELLLNELYPPEKTKKAKKGEEATKVEVPAAAPYTVVEKIKGEALVGRRYKPLFPYFENFSEHAFRILADDYVTTSSGTGIVHQAPAFGEDDFRVCMREGIITKGGSLVCPVDENGCFTKEVTDFAGRYVKEADADIIKYLDNQKRLISKRSIVHSYPFCWRSDTPLLYKAVNSWFVNVESFRDKLVQANDTSYWVPDSVKVGRFSNWLQDARDWNVSRNRYWGTPIPIWHSEDWEELVIVSSVAQLEELSGRTGINNIHRQYIDDITIPSKRPGQPPLRRVTEVFDCWFESGSMPYAQEHYPFENNEKFLERFPADFVAEGLDQTRGWFYTLLVLGVALFDKSPFKNVCVNGLVLAGDGKKMSKRLKNYPEPKEIIDQCGADALRMYIINSPVVRGEPLRFRAEGVRAVVRDIMLPLFNAAKFFIANTNACLAAGGVVSVNVRSTNEMDRWILTSSQTLLRYVKKEMGLYHLYNVVPGILRFVVDLSNWYVRMNRRRMKTTFDLEDRAQALSTMLIVLFDVSRIVAHIAPFVAEMLYQRIKPLLPADMQADSVHYLMIPEEDASLDDAELERAMSRMIKIVELLRVLRDRRGISMKRPVRQVIIAHPDQTYRDDVTKMLNYIKEEVNAFEVIVTPGDEYINTSLELNYAAAGKRLREKVTAVRDAVKAMNPEEVRTFMNNNGGVVVDQQLALDDVIVKRAIKTEINDFDFNSDSDVTVLLDMRVDQDLIDSWRAREFVNRVQQLRKKANLVVSDIVDVFFEIEEQELADSLLKFADQINQTLTYNWTSIDKKAENAVMVAEEENSISDIPIRIVFCKPQ